MKWTQLKSVTPSSDDVVSLAEAKAQLRVLHTEDDAFISRLIRAATATIEGPNGIGVSLLNATWVGTLSAFPCGPIQLRLSPIQSVTSITYRDASGDLQTLSDDLYTVDLDQDPAVIQAASWPSTGDHPGAVKVTFVAGHGADPDMVPADLIHAILMTVAHWYENREAVSEGSLKEVPMAVESILARYRVLSIG